MEATKAEITLAIRNEALRLGFSACGFSEAGHLEQDAENLRKWLNEGNQASMHYMEKHFEKRTDPRKLVEGSKSIISLLLNYNTTTRQEDKTAPVLSKYAFGTDYHFVMKDRMNKLFNFIKASFGPVSGRAFVDSAPVLDRAWAVRAGLGWIGKNSNLIHREQGSFVFIGEIICDLDLEYNKVRESDFCGACSACIDACPTEAILPGRTIDSRRCISFLTIENKEDISSDFSGKMKNYMFGCDICQDVCPWNRKIIEHNIEEFKPSSHLLSMTLEDWQELDKSTFNKLFRKSAVQRSGFKGLKRNIDFFMNSNKDL